MKAAGVLPVSINHQGKIVLLLGQETPFQDQNNPNDELWCGFGGKTDQGETPEETAAREFEEESMALWMSKDEMLHILQTNYNQRLLDKHTDDIYQEFVVYFDYDERIPDQFDRVLNYFQRCNKIQSICPEGHLEKSAVEWFTLDQIISGQVDKVLRPTFLQMTLLSYPYIVDGIENFLKPST